MKITINTEKKNEQDDDRIDLTELLKENYERLKKNKSILLILVLLVIASAGLYLRTRNTDLLGENVLALDPWLFYRYSKDIVENGKLVENDTMRYYPQGYDTSRESTIVSYLVAYSYRALKIFKPDLKLITVMQYYPPFVTMITILLIFFLGMKFFDWKVGLLSALLLAIAPGFLFRTIAGFADKDALSMTFMVMSMAFYFAALKEKNKKKFYLHSAMAGVSIALLGMTWGGYLFIVYSIAGLNFFKAFTSNVKKKDIILQAVWLGFLTLSDLFTNRYVIFKELPYEMAILAFIACIIEFFLWPYLDKKIKGLEKVPTGALSLLIAFIIIGSAGFVFLGTAHMSDMAESLLSRVSDPLGGGEAMGQSVSENQQPFFYPDWKNHVGYLIYLFLAGAVLLFYDTFKRVKAGRSLFVYHLTIAFTIFLGVIILSRYKLGHPITDLLSKVFLYSLPVFGAYLLISVAQVWRQRGKQAFQNMSSAQLLLLIWLFLHLLAARGAVRLIFPLVPVAIVVSSYFVVRLSEMVKEKIKDPLYNYLPYILIGVVIFMYANQAYASSASYGPSVVGDWAQGFDWIEKNTSEDAVFVHWWDYGYWIQGISNRTTITDGGNSYPYKNYLMGRHVFGGYSISEVYEQLVNFSKPDYFYVVSDDIGKFYQMARIGERNTYYTNLLFDQKVANNLGTLNATEFPELLFFNPTSNAIAVQEEFMVGNRVYATGQTFVLAVILPLKITGDVGEPMVAIYNPQYGQELMFPKGFCSPNSNCTTLHDDGVPGYVNMIQNGLIWIPEKAKDMFMTQLYLLNKTIPGFKLVWESSANLYDMQTIIGGRQNIRIYELDYAAMEDASVDGVVW